ncbi:RagB/SusD family nutrient uptake outer membrane protein [Cellulophaga sp. BC115SP]|uniref:RagB/SusD family nutrient uptake outer membrane protein n=1 Tax=Cellulophaga sp. BC115SP TaxID=2683263 RepID=UPI001412CA3D|nr:RagB/SusD family nutrient uptake outer membrane protein [Cellulophaga sp. BC115SP]NBB28197.1 RagB/SusD family nutrient uptake outer membrane protein [Cellulophaga sp. BC115SP]
MKNFKNILYPSLLTLAMGGAIGCTNLDDAVLDRLTDASSISPDLTLKSAYQSLGSNFTDQANVYALTEHPSDEMQGPTRGADWDDNGRWRNLHTHTWTNQSDDVLGAWNNLNRGHALANEVINNPKATAKQKAEAIYLRAFYMFYTMDLFGQVAFRDPANPGALPKALSRKEAAAQIISDLNANIPSLDNASGSNSGTATKEAARFLLAKVYLNKAVYDQDPSSPAGPFTFAKADMDQVVSLADAITGSGKFSLTANYFDNFHFENSSRSKELIFVIQNEKGASNNNGSSVRNRYYMTTHYNQVPSGWNGFTTLSDFYNSFEKTDSRLGAAVPGLTDKSGLRAGFLAGQQYDQNGVALNDRSGKPLSFTAKYDFKVASEADGIRVIKYIPDLSDIDSPANDYVFFRYADLLLMKAEALFRGGNTAGALTIINDLRKTRGVAALAALTANDILAERGRELYWEGWRRNDQIRFGTFANPVDNRTTASPAYRVVFPIPQRELEINSNLKQNVGY